MYLNNNEIDGVLEVIEVNNLLTLNEDFIEKCNVNYDDKTLHIEVRNEKKYGDGVVDFNFDFQYLYSKEYIGSMNKISLIFKIPDGNELIEETADIIVSAPLNLL